MRRVYIERRCIVDGVGPGGRSDAKDSNDGSIEDGAQWRPEWTVNDVKWRVAEARRDVQVPVPDDEGLIWSEFWTSQ
jgi:hypothetical protein